MPQPGPIAAVLFDFDGTLTLPGAIPFDLIKRLIRCPDAIPILEYIASLPSPAEARAATAVLEEHELAAARRSRPREGAEDLLLALAARGLPLGILSRNSRASIEEALRHFTRVTLALFAVVLTREDVTRHKPDPEGVLLAAERLGVSPDRLLVVGDYIFDIQAGQAAGARTAFLDDGTAAKVPFPPADFMLPSLTDLAPLLLDGAPSNR
jgi:HAD superfamily hydrolase (TIGR01509 family)